MPGEMPVDRWKLDLDVFQSFYSSRPKEEKWELIDGSPVMMPQPSLVHQRIAKNLETALDAFFIAHGIKWRADREIGVLLPKDKKYNPEPDVTVIDQDVKLGQIYADKFYLVAEVLSPHDKAWVLKSKLAYYQAHENCLAVLFLRQDRIGADLYLRTAGWKKLTIASHAGRIDIPGIGDIGALGALYRDTPLLMS
jgi:Uma2 family endonuclease